MSDNNTTRTGIEQGRAAFAYDFALTGKELAKNKEYKSYVKKMPMLIKTNGLGAAIAFAFAKGYKGGNLDSANPWGLLYFQIETWLKEKKIIEFNTNGLAKRLTEISSSDYRAATVEVLALLNWMKRFADALIEGESQDQNS